MVGVKPSGTTACAMERLAYSKRRERGAAGWSISNLLLVRCNGSWYHSASRDQCASTAT